MIFSKHSFFAITFCSIALLSCSNKTHTKEDVELAMKQYDRLIQKMDTDSIALLYTEDGDLGEMAHGRDSIRKFLASFKGFKVLSQLSTSDSINLVGDSALQKGTYRQVVITPKNDTVTVKGEYKANWVWLSKNGWHIKRMETKSL
ncbi:MAG: nuclear transport factor 2 family protein [Bacteroidetes bacterium]|nr:nuclear transport factor 2 family protein [Bacteroidota bacterium]